MNLERAIVLQAGYAALAFPFIAGAFFLLLWQVAGGGPISPYDTFSILVVIVLAAAVPIVAFVAPQHGPTPDPVEAPREGGDLARQARRFTLLFLLISVGSVLVAVLLVLAVVPVAHQTVSSRDFSRLEFVSSPTWNYSIQMPGFGQIVFNWTQAGSSGQVHVWVTGAGGSMLFDSFTTTGTPGFGGLVVEPGTYVIWVSSVSTMVVSLDLETASYSSSPVL